MLLVALNWYVGANVLLIVAYMLLSAIGFAGGKLSRAAPYRVQIGFARALIFAAILLPLGASLLGYRGGWATAAHVWSATKMEAVPPHASGTLSSGILTVSTLSLSIDQALHIVQWLFVAGFLLVLLRMLVELFATAAIIAGANHIRRSGRLRILASDRIQIPFSFWLPSRCFIVIPAGLLLRLDDLRFAICHEAQHHRQLDTGLLYLHLLCKSIFFWNPAAHWLDSRIRTLQELACDEAMVLRGRVPAQPYCESLLRIAESVISRRRRFDRWDAERSSGRSQTANRDVDCSPTAVFGKSRFRKPWHGRTNFDGRRRVCLLTCHSRLQSHYTRRGENGGGGTNRQRVSHHRERSGSART